MSSTRVHCYDADAVAWRRVVERLSCRDRARLWCYQIWGRRRVAVILSTMEELQGARARDSGEGQVEQQILLICHRIDDLGGDQG